MPLKSKPKNRKASTPKRGRTRSSDSLERVVRKWGSVERGSAEVRLNEDRTVDEIVMHSPLLFHLEQMDDGRWWMRLTRRDGQDMDINLYTKRGAAIACNVESHDGKIWKTQISATDALADLRKALPKFSLHDG